MKYVSLITYYYKNLLLFSIFQCLIPLFFFIRPVCIWMLRERIISDFFIFRHFLSKEFRKLDFLIETLELDICENDSFIGSLVFIELPDFPIGMTIFVANLHDICMSYHDKKCDTIWNFPFIFITHIRLILLCLYIHLEGECC